MWQERKYNNNTASYERIVTLCNCTSQCKGEYASYERQRRGSVYVYTVYETVICVLDGETGCGLEVIFFTMTDSFFYRSKATQVQQKFS